jgi:hypothetical protein
MSTSKGLNHTFDSTCAPHSSACINLDHPQLLYTRSDLHPYHEREKGLLAGTIVGHEFTGVVEECGSQVGQQGSSQLGLFCGWDHACMDRGRVSHSSSVCVCYQGP